MSGGPSANTNSPLKIESESKLLTSSKASEFSSDPGSHVAIEIEQIRPKLIRTRVYSPFKTPLASHIGTSFNSTKFTSDSNLMSSFSKGALPHRIEDFHLGPLRSTRRCPTIWHDAPTDSWGPLTPCSSQSEFACLQTKAKVISVDSLTTPSIQASTVLVADTERHRSNSSLRTTPATYSILDSRSLAPTPPLQEGRTARWLPGNCNVVENQILCELNGEEWNSLLLQWVIVILKVAFRISCFAFGAGFFYGAARGIVQSIFQPVRAEPSWENIIEQALDFF